MPVRHYIGILFVVLLLCLSVTVNAAPRAVPPGSFITRPVASTGEFYQLVNSDKVTAQRFANHFGMTTTQLANYIQSNLKLTTLDKPGTYTIYYRSKYGGVATRRAVLPKGELVFATLDGTPVIQVKCGNPLVKELPVKELVKPVEQSIIPPPETTQPIAVVPDQEPVALAMEPVQVASLVFPVDPIVETAVKADVLSIMDVAPYIVPAVLGAVVVDSNKKESVVPEPASLLVLGAGASGLVARMRRSKKRS